MLMREERKEQEDQSELEFKQAIFASDPTLYDTLFKEEEVDESAIEWLTPDSLEEVQEILAQMDQSRA